jgi:hypothetical protein
MAAKMRNRFGEALGVLAGVTAGPARAAAPVGPGACGTVRARPQWPAPRPFRARRELARTQPRTAGNEAGLEIITSGNQMTTRGNVSITLAGRDHSDNSQALTHTATGSRLTAQAAASGQPVPQRQEGMIMRIRFTRAGYAVAAGVAVTAMLGLSAAAAYAEPAATTACGHNCTDVSFVNPGRTAILASHSGYNSYNNLVRLVAGSNGAAKEDFTEVHVGKVDVLYCIGSAARPGSVFTNRQCQLLKIAGLDKATTMQLAFNPNNGGPKTMCIGTWNNTAPVINGQMRLVTCGVTADTVMILATHLPGGHVSPLGSFWMINGGSDNFSNPVVATSDGTYPSSPTWNTVVFNGNRGVDTQEVRLAHGPF